MGACTSCNDRSVSAESVVDQGKWIEEVTGKKKALLVGINYVGTSAQLRGCINDVMNQKRILISHYGLQESNILLLTENERPERRPTKEAILNGFKWLYEGAQPGDLLFFQYSGHGSQVVQLSSILTGLADCICPVDCIGAKWPDAVILDTEIHEYFYKPLPRGCKAIAVFDCCHSGTVANLPVQRETGEHKPLIRYLAPPAEMQPPQGLHAGVPSGIGKAATDEKYAGHQLWVFSGCQDDQTSADAWVDGVFQGAFTWAFCKALTADVWHETYIDLLEQTKANLKGYAQIPALTTTHAEYLNAWYFGKKPVGITRDVQPILAPQGRKKALLVGINYRGTNAELRGCINDVNNYRGLLTGPYGFAPSDVMVLTEDQPPADWPYKARLLEGMKWLVKDARPGDLLFFQYSGHGSQCPDQSGKEADGMSECICPLDCMKSWPEYVILDREIHKLLYADLHEDVKLVCIFDCCHSGTVADLEVKREVRPCEPLMSPHHYRKNRFLPPPTEASKRSQSNWSELLHWTHRQQKRFSAGVRRGVGEIVNPEKKFLWVYSGCQDDQTSADAFEDGLYQGAFSWSFTKALKATAYSDQHHNLLSSSRNNLRANYSQIPALSTTTKDKFSAYFLEQRTKISFSEPDAKGVCC